MRMIFTLLICFYAAGFSAELEPVQLAALEKEFTFTRAVYTLDARFCSTDTVLFVQKLKNITIGRVDSISRNELSVAFTIKPGFTDFGMHELAVLDSAFQIKYKTVLHIRYGRPPVVDDLKIVQRGVQRSDTLVVLPGLLSTAIMTVKGRGLFENSTFFFDDPSLQILDGPGWRLDFPPDRVRLGVQIAADIDQLGRRSLRIKNKNALEGRTEVCLVSASPPRLFGCIEDFVPDGTQKIMTISGENFFKNIQARLLPGDGDVKSQYVSPSKVQITLQLPVLEKSRSYRLVLTNEDGQSDTSRYFVAGTLPLAAARIKSVEHGTIFTGKETRVVFAVETSRYRKLEKQKSYEVIVDGVKFPVIAGVGDSLCEAVIQVTKGALTSLPNEHIFTINRTGKSALWKGIIHSKSPPQISYLSQNRILHPGDTLDLVMRGDHLDDIYLTTRDPEIDFKMAENRGDMIKFEVHAGKNATPGEYPLVVRTAGVPFTFPDYKLTVQPWQDFSSFIGVETTSLGHMPPELLWQGTGIARPIDIQDNIILKIYTSKIRQELGRQKIRISGVLMDSSNVIRAEAYGKKYFTVSNGSKVVTWHWRVRERIRSGDRIEITMSNPGGQNKVTEVFFAKPHWSEAFHGSTSFILFKVPFDGGEATTEILRSMGIGLTWQPVPHQRFIAFDGSFIVGNVTRGDDDFTVQVGLGLSVILWRHLQVGIGTNLSGSSFTENFAFVGSRFKLPIPWK